MYVQASEHFPGILLDMEERTLRFSMNQQLLDEEDGGIRRKSLSKPN
jgi:hypothetical protein